VFRDDPSGSFLDVDDVRCAWEEFVDALRDAHAREVEEEKKEQASASTVEGVLNARSYEALETPVMRRSESFNKLAMDLNLAAEALGSPTSQSPEGSVRGGIKRISSSGMLLGVGCSSRESSLRGGNLYQATLAASAAARLSNGGAHSPPK